MNKENTKRLPSEEMPWLEGYYKDSRKITLESHEEITMWHFIERELLKHGDKYPAFRYFGKEFSRSTVVSEVYRWARMFRGMGIKADDRVICYIPFTPEAAYVLFGLNIIGAWPVMLNMDSSADALAQASEGAKFGIVTDAVEENMAHIFRNSDQFERVLYIRISDSAPLWLKAATSLKNGNKSTKLLKKCKNYITVKDALDKWDSFDGELEPEYDPERPAVVTSSGGTSSKGYAKQIMDTNAAVISMFVQVLTTPVERRYTEGNVCYTGLPPFISTCIFVLFLAPLYRNMTCVIEPRFDSKVFTKNILKHRPQICLTPGRCWIYFFTQVERALAKGKKVDLSFFTMPIMGGDGCVPEDLRWMNGLLRKCGSKTQLVSGYGMSEVFSLLTVDLREGFAADDDTEAAVSVGTPMPGCVVGVFDKEGNELTYGERGELWVKATTLMKGYYKDEKRTAEAMQGGWYHSGDLASIDEKGHVYVFSRMNDAFVTSDGTLFHPAELEIKMNEDAEVHATMVNNMAAPGEKPRLAAHLVLHHDCQDREAAIRRLDEATKAILPDNMRIEGFKIHRHIFRMSKVCKTDRNSYRAELTGYCRPEGDTMVEVSFE